MSIEYSLIRIYFAISVFIIIGFLLGIYLIIVNHLLVKKLDEIEDKIDCINEDLIQGKCYKE